MGQLSSVSVDVGAKTNIEMMTPSLVQAIAASLVIPSLAQVVSMNTIGQAPNSANDLTPSLVDAAFSPVVSSNTTGAGSTWIGDSSANVTLSADPASLLDDGRLTMDERLIEFAWELGSVVAHPWLTRPSSALTSPLDEPDGALEVPPRSEPIPTESLFRAEVGTPRFASSWLSGGRLALTILFGISILPALRIGRTWKSLRSERGRSAS
jgi:hypothetical protein